MSMQFSDDTLIWESNLNVSSVILNDVSLRQLTKNQLLHLIYANELFDEVEEMAEFCEGEMSEIKETLKVEPQNREFLSQRLHLTYSKLQFYRSVLALDLQTALVMKDKHFEVSTEYLMFLSENNHCENDYLDECNTEKQYHEDFLEFLEKVELMTEPDLDDEFKYMPIVFRKRELERVSAH